MKVTELNDCIVCGGPLSPVFYRVTVQQEIIDATAMRQVAGLAVLFNGNMALATAFAPSDNVSTTLQTEAANMCQDCYLNSGVAAVLFDEMRARSTDSE